MLQTLSIGEQKQLHLGALRVSYRVPVPGSDETELHTDDGAVWLVANADLWVVYQGRSVRARVQAKSDGGLEGDSAEPSEKQDPGGDA